MARQLILYGRLISTEELIQAVEEVSAIRISEFAARLAAGRPSIAVVGAGRRARDRLSVERLIGA